MPTGLEKRPRHFLPVVAVEGRLLSCSGEPIHSVSVLEPKPWSLHQCCSKGRGLVGLDGLQPQGLHCPV